MKIKHKKRIIIPICILGLLIAISAIYINSITYRPSPELHSLVSSSDYKIKDDAYIFSPNASKDNHTALIIYTGAFVEPLSYGYIGKELDSMGYTVILPKFFINFALLGEDKATSIIKDLPDIKNWYIGGHSLGGVAASDYIYKNQNSKIKGLILMASYTQDKVSLKNYNIKVLSIYGTKDGLVSQEKIDSSKPRLPTDTVYFPITGGNHGQNGMYGIQKGDNPADISTLEQQNDIIKKINNFISSN